MRAKQSTLRSAQSPHYPRFMILKAKHVLAAEKEEKPLRRRKNP